MACEEDKDEYEEDAVLLTVVYLGAYSDVVNGLSIVLLVHT